MKKILIAFSFMLFAFSIKAQTIQVLTEGTRTSIRGLSVVSDNIFWASGSGGMFAKSIDGGKTIQWQQVKGYEKRDFRDIEAFDSNTAIIMGVDWPAIILKTKDGGKNWYKVFEDSTKGMFLDAMDFDGKNGVVIGDPINDTAFIAMTENNGEKWTIVSRMKNTTFKLNVGEAFFASSGTNIKLLTPKEERPYMLYVSGGLKSRFFSFDRHIDSLPIIHGKESTGANSMDINIKSKRAIVVGGDFANDKNSVNNCVLVDFDKESKFSFPQTPPHGYRSCVIYLTDKKLITCGTSGIDISNDGGNNWQLISNESFHVVQKAKKGNAVFLAGGKGRIAKVVF